MLTRVAFCRIFRFGQTKETEVTRLIVRNSVDEKLESMQGLKQDAIDAAIGDDGKRLGQLTIPELMRFFGPIADNEEGDTAFILCDEPQTDVGLPELMVSRENQELADDSAIGGEPPSSATLQERST